MLTMTVLSGPDLGRGGRGRHGGGGHGGGGHGGGHRHGGGGGRYFSRSYYPDYYPEPEPLCQVVVKNAAGQAVSTLVPCRLLSGR